MLTQISPQMTIIHLEINNKTGERLEVVEKTVWFNSDGGTWIEENGKHQLTFGYRGSGLLRFRSSNGELFSVVVGLGYTFTEWADVQVDLARTDTGIKLHPEYYDKGRLSHESHKEITRTSSKGAKVGISMGQLYSGELTAVLEYSYQ